MTHAIEFYKKREEKRKKKIKKIASWTVGIILFISFLGLIWSLTR